MNIVVLVKQVPDTYSERKLADQQRLLHRALTVVSVTEKINEPRYPSFKGIMAAKKKPVSVLSLADAGIDAAEVGLGSAGSQVVASAPKPPKSGGVKVTDEGEGGVAVVEFLAGEKLL